MKFQNATENTLRKRFGTHVTAATVTSILSKLFVLALIKILTILLTRDNFGVFSLWQSFAVLAATFSYTAYTASIWRFMPRRRIADDEKEKSRLFTASYLGSIGTVTLVFITLFLLYRITGFILYPNPAYESILLIAFFLSLALIIREITIVISGSEQNSREIIIFNIFCTLGSVSTAGFVALVYRDYFLVLFGLGIGYLIPAFIAFLLKQSKYGNARPTIDDMRQMLVFGGPSMVVSTVAALTTFLISHFIGLWVGNSEIGLFAVSVSIAGILAFTLVPTQTAYQAYLVNSYESKASFLNKDITRRIEELVIVLGIFLAWLAFVFAPILIEIFSTVDYLGAVPLIPFVLIATLLTSLSYFLKVRIDLVEKTYLTATIFGLSAITLGISSIILVPIFSLIGAGFAMVLQSIVIFLLMLITSHKQIPFTHSSGFMMKIIISIIMLIIPYWLLVNIGLHVYIAGSISAVLYLIFIYGSGVLTYSSAKRILRMLLGIPQQQ